ncbi:ABC-type transport auxiliary lipoprotein family protein [Ferrovibrio xuzhouensis]|uniref:ABC-type transport auxiliary lipoprotein family protein n=1 Tax=Ferrovibrio xuzhouensis TaxID=1576914 RepID=A0ABV7VIF2_9PROT
MTIRISRRRLLTGAAALGATSSLSACGGILPQAPPSNLYALSPKTTFIEDLPRADWQLVVEEPYAAGGLDTHRIAIMTNPYEVKYYPEARWAERVPRMVQTLLIESFESTGKIVSVGRQSVGLRSDFNLQSELREFQAELMPGSAIPQIRIKLNSKLIAQPRQQIVASASFERVTPAKSGDILAVVEAFDIALGGVLKETVQWTLMTGRKRAE